MKVEIDQDAGFCFGVQKTIEQAEKELLKEGKIYCLGEIVHNDEEIHRLKTKGLITIGYEEFRNLKNTRVLIRAHGEPPETYEIAKQNNIQLIDTTCPIVSRLQNRIKTCYDEILDENGQIVIFGKVGHPEVVGLIGQTNGRAMAVSIEADLDQIDFTKPIYLYSQTTRSKKGFKQIKKEITRRLKAAGNQDTLYLMAHQTICGQVSNREPNLIDFAKKHDAILFASGKKSSNGKMLYEICKRENPNSYFISSADDVETDMIKNCKTVGVSGATSTPSWLLQDVANKVSSLLH